MERTTPRHRTWVFRGIGLLWVLFAGVAPGGAAEYVLGQPVRLEGLRLDVQLRPGENELSVRADLRLRAREDGVRSFHLWMNRGFRIRHLRPARGMQVRWQRDRESPHFAPTTLPLRVEIPQELRRGESFEFTIFYHGRMSGLVNGVNRIGGEFVELALYSGWFPRVVGNGEFDLEMSVSAPEGFEILSHLPASRTEAGRRKARAWFQGRSQSEDVVLLAGSRLRRVDRSAGGIQASVVHRDLEPELVERLLEEMVSIERFYRDTLGLARAVQRLELVVAPRGGWNYARPPLIVMSQDLLSRGLDPETPEGRLNFRTLAHEIAHDWWTLADHYTYDDWLNEGLAEYCALLALSRRHGENARTEAISSYMARIDDLTQAPSIGASLRSDPAADALYFAKGAMVLRLLANVVGAEVFHQALREYHRTFAARDAGAGDTVAFRHIVESHHGADLVWFFQPWVYDAALPRLQIEYQVKEGDGDGFVLDGVLRQRGEKPFALPVDLAASGSEGERVVRKMQMHGPDLAFSIPLPFRPVSVELDPSRFLPGLGSAPVVDRPPGEIEALLRRAQGAEDAGRPEEALGLYRQVLDSDPDSFHALYRLGRVLSLPGAGSDPRAALVAHRRADAVRGGVRHMRGWNLVRMGELLRRMGAPVEAAEAYRGALQEEDYLGSRQAARDGLSALAEGADGAAPLLPPG